MKRSALILATFLPLTLGAFEKKPWFGNVWEFQFDAAYTYSRYRHVQGAHPDLKHVSNNQLVLLGLGFSPSSQWDIESEIEFAESTEIPSFGMRSLAFQGRCLWLDDILGDPVSLTTGLSLRGVPHHQLTDVSCPYHANVNLELSTALGKEWERGVYWTCRTFLFGAVGMAERGSPWTRALLSFEINSQDKQQWQFYAEGYWGFGGKKSINVKHFDGYASIHHGSLDVSAVYRYLFDIWGSLSLEYTYRVYARLFPEHVNAITLRYNLPFSLF